MPSPTVEQRLANIEAQLAALIAVIGPLEAPADPSQTLMARTADLQRVLSDTQAAVINAQSQE